MESPIRKYQKQKEYQRHKVLRKIKRRQQRKAEQMQKIAENEHRYFKIVSEYNPERSRHELTIKEITPDGQETL